MQVNLFGWRLGQRSERCGHHARDLVRLTVQCDRLSKDRGISQESASGSAAGIAVRTRRNLTSNVGLEFGGLFAKPEQQFGPSTLFVPEAQLQYRWGAGRLSPYVGGGIGAALVKSDFRTDWDPTLSFAVGTGVRLTERLGVTGEFRLRGHDWDFVGTSAEISAGLAWRLPSF
jgi:opacity protein-like surface antigen